MTCHICGHDEVVKRKRTDPPTEAGTYYAVYVRVTPPILGYPDMETGERKELAPGEVHRSHEIVDVTKYMGKVGIWDDDMERIDPLPEEYEWYGRVPKFEVIP